MEILSNYNRQKIGVILIWGNFILQFGDSIAIKTKLLKCFLFFPLQCFILKWTVRYIFFKRHDLNTSEIFVLFSCAIFQLPFSAAIPLSRVKLACKCKLDTAVSFLIKLHWIKLTFVKLLCFFVERSRRIQFTIDIISSVAEKFPRECYSRRNQKCCCRTSVLRQL